MLTIREIFDVGANDVEFLRSVDLRKRKRWLATVVAMANSKGGVIFFGVESDENVVGCDKNPDLIPFIKNSIASEIQPAVEYNVFEYYLNFNDKNVLVLSVQEGALKPYYYLGDSIKKVFIRVDGATKFAHSSDFHALKPRVTRYGRDQRNPMK